MNAAGTSSGVDATGGGGENRHVSEESRGRGGSAAQKFVYPKRPKSIGPSVNFILSPQI